MFREETPKEISAFFNNPNFVHFVGLLSPPRPGVQLFAVRLEHEYYPPGSDMNNDFCLRMFEWEDMKWIIVSVPKTEMDILKKVAHECGLKIADGVPTVFGSGKIETFPINNERVFTLENLPDSPFYGADRKKIKELLAEERRKMEKIFHEAEQRIKKKGAKK